MQALQAFGGLGHENVRGRLVEESAAPAKAPVRQPRRKGTAGRSTLSKSTKLILRRLLESSLNLRFGGRENRIHRCQPCFPLPACNPTEDFFRRKN